MRIIILLLLVISIPCFAQDKAQTCAANCPQTTLILFDFDVKISASNTNSELFKKLYFIAPLIRKEIESRKTCLDYIDVNEVKQTEEIFHNGSNVPDIYVQGTGSYDFAQYLLTGTVTGEGNVFLVTATIETSVSRKKNKNGEHSDFFFGRRYLHQCSTKNSSCFGPCR